MESNQTDANPEAVGVCSCGRVLYPCFDENKKRIGVTHTIEDDDHHMEYWSTDSIIKRHLS